MSSNASRAELAAPMEPSCPEGQAVSLLQIKEGPTMSAPFFYPRDILSSNRGGEFTPSGG